MCGTWTAQLVMDTDGAALSMGPFTQLRDAPCASEPQVARVIEALEVVESWSVTEDDLIEFIGATRLVLVRTSLVPGLLLTDARGVMGQGPTTSGFPTTPQGRYTARHSPTASER